MDAHYREALCVALYQPFGALQTHLHSATLEETALQEAVVAMLNEMFRQREAWKIVTDCVASTLAEDGDGLSLPAVEARLQSLQMRQVELLQLVMTGGVGCTEYDEELHRVTMAKTELLAKKAELECEDRTAGEFDRRMTEISGVLERENSAIEGVDEVLGRQLVSNIKVLDKNRVLVRFKDGTEEEQAVEDGRKKVSA